MLYEVITDNSRQFRLQGSHKLQIRAELDDIEKRFVTIEDLLERLAVKDGQDA